MQKLGRIAAVAALALTVAVPFGLAQRNPLGGKAQRANEEKVQSNHRMGTGKHKLSPEAHAILAQMAQQRRAEHGVKVFPVTGDISENTIFTTIVPCRLVDTRKPLAGILVAGASRTFTVIGNGNGDPNDPNNPFAKQGGNAAGCGLPGFSVSGEAQVQAIEVNYVAVSAAGPGNLQAFPSDEPNAPVTAVINFNKLNPPLSSPLNLANGTVTGVRQDPAITGDITVKANVSNVHLIVDVVGYYSYAFGNTLSGDNPGAGLTVDNQEIAVTPDPNNPTDPNQPVGLRAIGGFAGVDAYAVGNDYGYGYAVIGTAPSTLGTGVWGNGQGSGGWGVRGSGYDQGVHGDSQYGRGVVGASLYNNAVYGVSAQYYGVYGLGYGGVRGIGLGTYGYGLRGTGATGVRGYGNGTAGGAGVLGIIGGAQGSAFRGVSLGYTDANGLDLTSAADPNDPDPNNAAESNFIIAWANGRTVRKFRVDNNGNTFGKSFNTTGADFAEMLPAEEGLQPGDVLTVGQNGKLTRSTQPYQDSVVGIYSTLPGLVGGSKIDGHNDASKAPLAVVGIVPVKASAENGTIHPGDLLVASSIPGHAMRAGDTRSSGTILGKALEPLIEGTGTIQMLVTLQ